MLWEGYVTGGHSMYIANWEEGWSFVSMEVQRRGGSLDILMGGKPVDMTLK